MAPWCTPRADVPTTATGKGRILGMGEWTDDDLVRDVEQPIPDGAPIVNDWFWFGAPDATIIPWTYLSMPLAMRQDQPINSATITGASNATATAVNTTSQAQYGTFGATATLNTVLAVDAANLAEFVTTYYANPPLRCPQWTFDLTGPQLLPDEVKWLILGREIGDRVTLGPATLTDPGGTTIVVPVPAGLPAAARSLVIEGITHTSGPAHRLVTWTTAPLLGTSPGAEGPWFRSDLSFTDGTDVLPY